MSKDKVVGMDGIGVNGKADKSVGQKALDLIVDVALAPFTAAWWVFLFFVWVVPHYYYRALIAPFSRMGSRLSEIFGMILVGYLILVAGVTWFTLKTLIENYL